MNDLESCIQGGLDILRREARYTRRRSWKRHNALMRAARDHVLACGGDWESLRGALSREFAELMRL